MNPLTLAALDAALGIQDAHVMAYMHNWLKTLREERIARSQAA